MTWAASFGFLLLRDAAFTVFLYREPGGSSTQVQYCSPGQLVISQLSGVHSHPRRHSTQMKQRGA